MQFMPRTWDGYGVDANGDGADWLISKGLGWQINAQSKVVGGELKGWSYPGASVADNSNTQYALLGLYAAKQAGAKIDDSVWTAILDYYTRTQHVRLRYVGLVGVLQQRRSSPQKATEPVSA